MQSVAATGQWVILYMGGKPCILAGGPPGATHEKVLEQFRAAMLGHIPEGTTLESKDMYEAPIEDVIRVAVVSLMTAVSKVDAMVTDIRSGLAQRGLLRH